MKNVFHWLLCLNTWSLVWVGTVLLEVWGVRNLTSLTVLTLCFVFVIEDMIAWLSAKAVCCHAFSDMASLLEP